MSRSSYSHNSEKILTFNSVINTNTYANHSFSYLLHHQIHFQLTRHWFTIATYSKHQRWRTHFISSFNLYFLKAITVLPCQYTAVQLILLLLCALDDTYLLTNIYCLENACANLYTFQINFVPNAFVKTVQHSLWSIISSAEYSGYSSNYSAYTLYIEFNCVLTLTMTNKLRECLVYIWPEQLDKLMKTKFQTMITFQTA